MREQENIYGYMYHLFYDIPMYVSEDNVHLEQCQVITIIVPNAILMVADGINIQLE